MNIDEAIKTGKWMTVPANNKRGYIIINGDGNIINDACIKRLLVKIEKKKQELERQAQIIQEIEKREKNNQEKEIVSFFKCEYHNIISPTKKLRRRK